MCCNNETKMKMKLSHSGLTESADTKRKKSNQIYAVDSVSKVIIVADSGKLFGDYIGKSKDYIKNCLRQPSSVCGYRLFYADKDKRLAIRVKMLSKRSIRDIEYMSISELLDEESVETNKMNFRVEYLTYENSK